MKHMLRMLQRGLHTTAPQCTRVPAACRARPASAAWHSTQRHWTHQALIAFRPWGSSRLASTGSDSPVVAGQDSASRPQETPATVPGDGSLEVDVDVCIEGELDQHSRCCVYIAYRYVHHDVCLCTAIKVRVAQCRLCAGRASSSCALLWSVMQRLWCRQQCSWWRPPRVISTRQLHVLDAFKTAACC